MIDGVFKTIYNSESELIYESSKMDPLSDLITLLRPRAAIAKPISGRGQWGVRYRSYDAPGFTLVLTGEAWLTLGDREPLPINEGDFLLLPTTPAFSLCSKPGAPCITAEPLAEAVRHGDQEGKPDFVALGGSFSIESANAPLLLALLPNAIYIPASAGRGTRFGRLIELLSEECVTEHPGKELIVQRLLETLLIETLRWDIIGNNTASAGLLNGLRDPAMARVLRAIHEDVRRRWTVADMAGIAGKSRSGFAARFNEILGCAPIEYLARWRIAIAKQALLSGAKSLDRIADEIGYESASAFSTAFSKRLGCPPGRFARRPELSANP
ncbi:AraC-like DNA-binding protein [Agrobacterium sp. SORGH_AS 745]|nr:AraC family transcriptional regulator [Agrobacterium sp. SORGH_AS_0745]MDP9759685.1 AraC-like DNA-binding protein [Agrobacterium tumefaciens]MDQ1223492.1 AraC-like DNA-binding protein [Agrobacterium sp. SORGH_AS_0745]